MTQTSQAAPAATGECTPADAVRRAQDGDQEALAHIARCAEPKVRSVVRRFRLDVATAEDVVQNTMLRMLTRIDTLRAADRFDAWIRAIARNEAISVLRKRSREIPSELGDNQWIVDPDPAADLIRLEDIATVRKAVARLPEKSRKLIDLLFAEDQVAYEDVAREIGRPKGSIGPTRQRCLSRLHDLIEDDLISQSA